MVSRAAEVFDASGAITDAKVKEQLERFIAGFAEFAGKPTARAG